MNALSILTLLATWLLLNVWANTTPQEPAYWIAMLVSAGMMGYWWKQ